MAEIIIWLIVPTDHNTPQQVIPNSFLGIPPPTWFKNRTTYEEKLTWVQHIEHALQFVRRDDALAFIDIMRTLHDKLPHSHTLSGLRSGDPPATVITYITP